MLRLSDALRGNSRGANSTDVGVKILVVHHPSRGIAALNNAVRCSTFGPISFTATHPGYGSPTTSIRAPISAHADCCVEPFTSTHTVGEVRESAMPHQR